jgi:hypothetical protein
MAGWEVPSTIGSEREVKGQNLPAQASVWSACAAVLLFTVARPLRPFLPEGHYLSPYLGIPVCGLISIVFGIVGLTRVRRTGSGKARSVVGVIAGFTITLVSVAAVLFVWQWNRANFTF